MEFNSKKNRKELKYEKSRNTPAYHVAYLP